MSYFSETPIVISDPATRERIRMISEPEELRRSIERKDALAVQYPDLDHVPNDVLRESPHVANAPTIELEDYTLELDAQRIEYERESSAPGQHIDPNGPGYTPGAITWRTTKRPHWSPAGGANFRFSDPFYFKRTVSGFEWIHGSPRNSLAASQLAGEGFEILAPAPDFAGRIEVLQSVLTRRYASGERTPRTTALVTAYAESLVALRRASEERREAYAVSQLDSTRELAYRQLKETTDTLEREIDIIREEASLLGAIQLFPRI